MYSQHIQFAVRQENGRKLDRFWGAELDRSNHLYGEIRLIEHTLLIWDWC